MRYYLRYYLRYSLRCCLQMGQEPTPFVVYKYLAPEHYNGINRIITSIVDLSFLPCTLSDPAVRYVHTHSP